jgi:type II secretory pathway pseudopilin PulG
MPLFHNSRGFAYIALLVVIVVIGLSLGAAGRYWSHVVLRDKEEELLFRGDQYRLAIEQYFKAVPAAPEYPSSIDDLLMDNRTGGTRRYLRQRYKDPISGEDFVEIRHPVSKRIIGVNSPSDKQPLKQSGFPDIYSSKTTLVAVIPNGNANYFVGAVKYSDWLFVSTIAATGIPPGSQLLIPPKGFVPDALRNPQANLPAQQH